MKLKDYLEKQREERLSEFQKMKIFEQFLIKTQKTPIYNKLNFYWKVAVYFSIIFLLILAFYSPIVNLGDKIDNYNNGQNIAYVHTGFLVEDQIADEPGLVLADYVGKIIEAQGDIRLSKDGKEIESNMIENGSTILLLNSAEIKFEVSTGVISIIKGPAKFQIDYVGQEGGVKNYVINLIYGDYFQVFSEENTKDNLIIKTESFEIEPQFVKEKMDLKITTEGEKKIVENNGSPVVVKKVVNNKKTYSALQQNQTAEIDDDVKILEEVKQITKEVTNKEIVETFEMTGETSVPDEETVDYNELITDTKIILSEDKLDTLKQFLYPNFVEKDVQGLVMAYLEGNKSALEIAYKNSYARLDKLYTLFEFSFDSDLIKLKIQKGIFELDDLSNNLDQLISKLNRTYYIPPQYINRLRSELAWLLVLQDTEFGKLKGQDFDFEGVYKLLGIENHKDALTIN